MGEFAVYRLIDPRNNEVFYIGCTRSLALRKKSHRYGQKGTAIYPRIREIIDAGMVPDFDVIQEGMSKIEALWLERELIVASPSAMNKQAGCTLSNLLFPRASGSVEAGIKEYIERFGQKNFDYFYGSSW